MKKIAIIGSGHLGQQITHHIHSDTSNIVVGYFDEYQTKGTIIKDIPIIGGNNDIITCYKNGEFDEILIAIGYKHMNVRKLFYDKLKNDVPFHTFIHSTTFVDPSANIGYGTIIYPGCIIDQDVIIEENVLINISNTISHDSRIGKHCFLSPSIAIAGFVSIGEQCNIGINTTIIDNIIISDNIQTGGGTVVIKNLNNQGLYVGNPARFIK
ncbi:PglD-related sugar-binding protein [Elizabethkingia bruuniana]|uniref:PglD-related sugar-binding protein n=1 Tax=Elizabethkingia bruuniana TaxID=1756149 RepID=UPI00201269DF|nr:hypothetical protein [Elizabethkingia bruuniana]MCL1636226.1 hypothetical protein [Elizabethkingia bruuniana]